MPLNEVQQPLEPGLVQAVSHVPFGFADERGDAVLNQRPCPGEIGGADDGGRRIGRDGADQGKPVDVGGYYYPNVAKAEAAMRPSATLNEAIASLAK